MKLAVLILAHKNPQQLQRLVDHLLLNDCSVFIHIDQKTKTEFNGFIKRNENRAELYICSEYKVYWGSYNQILATISLLRTAVQKIQFDYVHLISGQDLPVKPLKDFKEFLKARAPLSFLAFDRLPDEKFAGRGGLERVQLWWLTDSEGMMSRFFDKVNIVIHGLQRSLNFKRRWSLPLFAGANWFTIHKVAADFIVLFLRENPAFLRKFKRSRLADEIVIQTIMLNSQLKDKVINDHLRFIDWQTGPEFPKVLRNEDLNRIKDSPAFFARKFDENVDHHIIDMLYSSI